MTSAITRYGYEKTKEVLLATLKTLAQDYPDNFYTANLIALRAKRIAVDRLPKINEIEPWEISLKLREDIRKTFSNKNLVTILNGDLSQDLETIKVIGINKIETSYRLNQKNTTNSQPSQTP